MRNLFRCFAWICLALLQFGLAVHAHEAAPAEPTLDATAVMQVSLYALRPKLGNGAVGAMHFDPVTGVWQFQFDSWQGTAQTRLEITLDESTGMICAHAPN